MKRKGLIFVLLAIFSLFLVGNLQQVSAATGTWEKVTDSASLAVGDKVIIVASGSNYAMSTTQNTNNRSQASVTKSGNTVTFSSGVQELTLKTGKVSGSFAFYTGSGYLYAASSSKNYLKTETTLSNNSSWTIEISATGVATIKAQGTNTRNWMRYNSSNNPPIFACYSSGQADICLYKFVESGEPSVKISAPANTTLGINQTLSFAATTDNFEGTVTWSTSDATIASFSGNVLTAHKAGTVTVTATAGTATDTININVVNPTAEVNRLFKEYYGEETDHEGVYTKDTTINISQSGFTDAVKYGLFHADSTKLVRSTYYTKDALWMSQDAEGKDVKYSYYGSAANNGGVTYGVAESPKTAPEKVNTVLSGAGKESMEAYYTTLFDLKENTTATWKLDGNGYATSDATMLQFFLDFTAPCFLNFSNPTSKEKCENYFTFKKAKVEEVDGTLVLELHVSSLNSGHVNVVEGEYILSTAVISDREYEEYQEVQEYTYDLVSKFSAYSSGWSGYTNKTIPSSSLGSALPNASINFSYVSKQSGTITDRPVMASNGQKQYVSFELSSGKITSVTFNFMQWGSKTFKDIHIEYNNGSQWVSCSNVITNPSSGSLTSTEITGTISQVRLVIYNEASGNQQIGITSIVVTASVAE